MRYDVDKTIVFHRKCNTTEEEINNYLLLKGGKMSGNIDMRLNCIKNSKTPDGISKIYMSTFVNSYIYTNSGVLYTKGHCHV